MIPIVSSAKPVDILYMDHRITYRREKRQGHVLFKAVTVKVKKMHQSKLVISRRGVHEVLTSLLPSLESSQCFLQWLHVTPHLPPVILTFTFSF